MIKKSKSVEHHKTTVVNLQHVLTLGLAFIPVLVTKDIPEMERFVKVRKLNIIQIL